MRAAAVCLTLLGTVLSAQEPLPVSMLPPDTAAIIGINLARLRGSHLGQQLFAEFQAKNPNLAQLASRGFDPFTQVDQILLSAPLQQGMKRGLFLIRAVCYDATLQMFAQPGRDAVESTYGGRRIVTVKAKDGPTSFTCVDGTLIAGGDPASLKAALARGSGGPGPSRALAEQAAALSAEYDVWLVSRARLSDLASEAPNAQAGAFLSSGLMSRLKQISAGISLADGLNIALTLTAQTTDDADAIAGGFTMLAGMLKSDPKRGAQFAPIADNLRVRTDGNTAHVDLKLTEDQYTSLAAMMPSAMGVAAPRAIVATQQPAGLRKRTPPPPMEIKIQSSPKDMGNVTVTPPK